MGERYKDYSDLANTLRKYGETRKGEIAELTYKAALTIDTLVGRLKILEKQIEQSEDDRK